MSLVPREPHINLTAFRDVLGQVMSNTVLIVDALNERIPVNESRTFSAIPIFSYKSTRTRVPLSVRLPQSMHTLIRDIFEESWRRHEDVEVNHAPFLILDAEGISYPLPLPPITPSEKVTVKRAHPFIKPLTGKGRRHFIMLECQGDEELPFMFLNEREPRLTLRLPRKGVRGKIIYTHSVRIPRAYIVGSYLGPFFKYL